MVYRVFVEKKPGLRHEASSLRHDIRHILLIKNLSDVRLLNRYDVEGVDQDVFDDAVKKVLSEPQLDDTYTEMPVDEKAHVFAVEFLPGQYDQRADSAAQCIQILRQVDRPLVRSAKVYMLYGDLTEAEIAEIKKYVINPVEAREASLEKPETLSVQYDIPTTVETLDGFIEESDDQLKRFLDEKGLAMDL
ncbi:MAG: phosphoribosylformylglycinamidine synthase, partial [Oribacterium sp.]|nr:phosphoribosylformylglycinamidine synthase [Oribacterium sp.]